MKKVLPLIAAIVILLTACGEKATPTMDAGMVQASAVAMAFTMQAQTQQAAPPTATQIPTQAATETPIPVPTLMLPPTLPPTLPATPTKAAGACSSLMDPNWGGPSVYLKIKNETKGSLSMSLYLYETAFACGFVRLPAFGPQEDNGINVPEGCYWPSAYINDPKKPRSIEGPKACIHGNDKIELIVSYDGFRWLFP